MLLSLSTVAYTQSCQNFRNIFNISKFSKNKFQFFENSASTVVGKKFIIVMQSHVKPLHIALNGAQSIYSVQVMSVTLWPLAKASRPISKIYHFSFIFYNALYQLYILHALQMFYWHFQFNKKVVLLFFMSLPIFVFILLCQKILLYQNNF